jgi:hypothetical protein
VTCRKERVVIAVAARVRTPALWRRLGRGAMTTQTDINYHLRREEEERTRAERACDPGVRRAHEALAKVHARRAAQGRACLARRDVTSETLVS